MRTIRGCNVAVAGGCGFLGSHMVQHLVEDRGCKVLVLDNLVAGRLEFLHPDATFEHCDITGSEDRMRKIFEAFGVRFCWNYVAEPYIPVSFARPLHVFNVNAVGALQVINAAQDAGVEGILQVSSAEIYGNGYGEFGAPKPPTWTGKLDESAPVEPHSSYGAAKAAIDYLVQARWREAKTPALALRQFNCLGERETHPYVVTTIIEQLAAIPSYVPGCRTIRLGNNSVRDFLYAGDAVRMAAELLEKGQFGDVYNLGSEGGIKIYDLAQRVAKVMGLTAKVEEDESRKRPWEIWHLTSDNTKIYRTIDARPEVSLDEALNRTVAWFHLQGESWGFRSSTEREKR